MLLWAPLRHSVAMLWGESLHDLDRKSCGGAHRVAPEVASKVKAWAEAMFHMYYLV
jgi:hypothetical protein